jgi:UDP-glucose 4-epimerase
MARVAITGGSGFIGRAVDDLLREYGFETVILDRSNGFDVVSSDVVWATRGCDTVVHLAGVLGTEELFDLPEHAIDVNVKGTARILKACTINDLHFVGITMPQVWSNVYQATKGAAVALGRAWQEAFGLRVSWVRAFNVFGEGQHVHGVQKIVPTFATRAWKNQPIPVWGDGNQTVDLIYVRAVAKIFAAIVADPQKFGGAVIDAGTGHLKTVNEVAGLVLKHAESPSPIVHLPMRAGERPADVQAKGEGWDLLGWFPRFNQEQLMRTVHWYKQDRP